MDQQTPDAEGAAAPKPPKSVEAATRYLTKYIVGVPVYLWENFRGEEIREILDALSLNSREGANSQGKLYNRTFRASMEPTIPPLIESRVPMIKKWIKNFYSKLWPEKNELDSLAGPQRLFLETVQNLKVTKVKNIIHWSTTIDLTQSPNAIGKQMFNILDSQGSLDSVNSVEGMILEEREAGSDTDVPMALAQATSQNTHLLEGADEHQIEGPTNPQVNEANSDDSRGEFRIIDVGARFAIKRCAGRLSRTRKQVYRNAQTLEQRKVEVDGLVAKTDKLATQLEEEKLQSYRQKLEIDILKSENQKLKDASDGRNNAICLLLDEIAELKCRISKREQSHRALEKQVETFQKQAETCQDILESLNNKLDLATAKIDEQERRLSRFDSAIEASESAHAFAEDIFSEASDESELPLREER